MRKKNSGKPRGGRRVKRVSFAEVARLSRAAVRKMKADGFKPDVLVGVGRGGWTPAVIVSNLLRNPRLYSVKCEYYDERDLPVAKPRISQTVGLRVKGKRVLIIDEVADSGGSLRAIARHFRSLGTKEFKFLVLHWKTCAKFEPEYWGERTDGALWLKYPWDITRVSFRTRRV
ncbi:MAG: phosphoribosyltransferase family protein [Candidatus Micrarchaeota archaeon]